MRFYHLIEHLSVLQFAGLFTIFLTLKTIIFCGGLDLISRILKNKRKINQKPTPKAEVRAEFLSSLRAMLVEIILMISIFASGIIKNNQATHLTNILTIVFVFIFFEIWFYATHRLMHTKIFYKFHRQHHSSTVITTWSASNFSITEKVILFIGAYIIPLALTNFIDITFEGIILYNIYNFISNAVGHSNIEFGGKLLVLKPMQRLITTSTYHNLHHTHPNKNFALFMPMLDFIFKTNYERYEQVYKEVIGASK